MSATDDDGGGVIARVSAIDEADAEAQGARDRRRRQNTKANGADDVARAREKRGVRQARQDEARDATFENPLLEDCRLGVTLVIKVETDEMMVNDKAIYMLAQHSNDVFQHAGRLVRIVPATAYTAPKIDEIKRATLRELIASAAEWQSFSRTQERWQRCHPPDWCVDAVLARGAWSGVRKLSGIVEAPILRPDGTVLDVPGYDQATELFYMPPEGVTFQTVPAEPSREEAKAALAALNEVVDDFPFASEAPTALDGEPPIIGAHRSAALAVLLTMCTKDAIAGNIPLCLGEAAAQGTGKTLMFDAFSMIAFGRPLARTPYPRDEAELSKTITALAIEGAATIFFDNIGMGQTLGGPVIDALLTGLIYKGRILGVSQTVEVPFRPIVLATGNNVELGSDTTRRVLLVRLEAQDANPSKRSKFRHEDLLAWVSAHRPRLLCAALTIIKAYVHASRPDQRLGAWGSYRGWSQVIRGALVWTGAEDPGKVRDTIADAASDQDLDLLKLVIAGLRDREPQTAIQLCRLAERSGQDQPDLRAALDQMTGPNGKLTPRGVARRLRQLRNRVVHSKAGREQLLMNTKSSEGTLWSVDRLPDVPPPADANAQQDNRTQGAASPGVAGQGAGGGADNPGAATAGTETSSEWQGL